MNSIISILRCPICTHPFTLADHSLVCSLRHSFDIAREGYVNLLQKKVASTVGDSREMLQARRAFFEHGHYRPISNQLNDLVTTTLMSNPSLPVTILDAGCGEGYYSGHLQQHLMNQPSNAPDAHQSPPIHIIGIDIARDAIRLAARRYKNSNFLVADTKEVLPFMDHTFGIVLAIFAPRNPKEFARLLAPGGSVIIIAPGPDHLHQLRQHLPLLQIEENKQQHIIEQFSTFPTFSLTQTLRITYTIQLAGSEIAQLVLMTPTNRHLSPEQRQQIARLEPMEITVDCIGQIFQTSFSETT